MNDKTMQDQAELADLKRLLLSMQLLQQLVCGTVN